MKSKKIPCWIAGLCLLVILTACGNNSSAGDVGNSSPQSSPREPAGQSDTETRNQKANAEDLSEVSQVYTFSLDGCEYSLPCRISEFLDNGWAPGSEYQDMVIDEVGTDSIFLSKRSGGAYVQLCLHVYNETSGTEIGDLFVGEISVNDGQGCELEMKGIKIGAAADEVAAVFAEKAVSVSEARDTNGRICRKYRFTDGNIDLMPGTYEYCEFIFDPEPEKLFQIVLSYYPVSA